jgi:hypothetical protein
MCREKMRVRITGKKENLGGLYEIATRDNELLLAMPIMDMRVVTYYL